jgi:hypothetical protein
VPEQAGERREQQQREDCAQDPLKQRHGAKAPDRSASTTRSDTT